MQSKILRLSKRTVSIVLAMLMMVSVLGIGSLITTNAATTNKSATGTSVGNTTYYITGDGSAGSWGKWKSLTKHPSGYYSYFQCAKNTSFKVSTAQSYNDCFYSFTYDFWGNTKVRTTADQFNQGNGTSPNGSNNFWIKGGNYVVIWYPNTDLRENNAPLITACSSLPTAPTYKLHYSTTSWNEETMTTSANPVTESSTWTASVSLTGGGSYEFEIEKVFSDFPNRGTLYYGNSGTMVYNNCSAWDFTNSNSGTHAWIDTVTTGTYTFTLNSTAWQDKSVNLTVTYPKYSMSGEKDSHGSANPTVGTASVAIGGSSKYTAGAANTGYKFKNWTVTAGTVKTGSYTGTNMTSSTTNPITVYPYGAATTVTLKANYTAKQSALTFDYTTNGGSGTPPTNLKGTYDSAMTTIPSANLPAARSGYTLLGFYDDPDGGNKYYNANGTSAATWNKNTESGTTLYARWSRDSYTGLTVAKQYTTDNSSYSTLSSGSAVTIGATSVYQGDGVSVSAPSISGYTFATWYSANGTFASATSASTTFTPSANSASAIAKYKKNYTFSGTKNGTGSGTLTVPDGTVLAGQSFTISVTPDASSTLTAFTVNGVNKLSSVSNNSYTANATTFGTTSPINVVATFTLKTYTVTFSETGGSGTFQADEEAFTSGSTVTHGNHSFTISAPSGYNVTAVTGFGEGSWTGIGTGTASLASTAVTGNKTVNVTYASATTPGVTVEADYDNSSNKANIGNTVTVTATKTHPTGSAGAMTYSVKLDDVAATVNTDYTISSSTAGNVTTYTIVPLKAGVFKVTAGYTDTGNPSATATFGVNAPTITVANNTTIKIGESYTPSPSTTNTNSLGSGWTVVYSATSGSAATLSGDSIKAVTTGTAGFSASLQYNGVQKAATTFSVTPVVPTVAFGTTTAASINIGGTVTRAASKGSNEVGAGITSDTVSYSSSQTSYATVNGSGVVTGVAPGTTTISATRTIVCDGVTTTVDTATNYNVTVNTPGISAFSYSTNQIYIDGNTSNPSVTTTNPSSVSSPWSVTYSITGGSDYATINTTTGVVTGVYTGSATNRTVTVTASLNYNGTSKATRTATVTVKPPTVSFTSSSAVALNVGATNTNTASGSNPTGGTVTYSGTNQYINVNASTGQVTALKPTSSAQTVTASYAVTRNSKTTTVSTTYNVTVGTPTITFNGPTTLAVGDKAATTVSATNVTSPSYTYDVKTGSSYASVDSNGKVTGLAAGTATIRVTATKESWTDTAEITVNVQAPSMTIADVESDGSTVLYTTVGTNITKAISANFNGTYSYSYSKSGVATASVSNGTLTITPQAKGSTTITVTDTKAAAQIASAKRGISKGKLATGAAGDIEVSQTFTVNVAEADNSQFITLASTNSTAYVYYWGSNGANSNARLEMTKVGTDDAGRNVFARKIDATTFSNITGIIFTTNSDWGNQTNDVTGDGSGNNKLTNGSTKFNSFYLTGTNSGNNSRPDVKGYTTTITLPQITTPSTLEVAVDDTETITPTVVNNVTPAATLFVSDDTDTATVGASTGVVTGVDAGSANVTAYAFAPKPHSEWQSWITDSTTKDIIAGSSATSVSVTDTPRTINFSNTLRTTTAGVYDQPNANLAGTISASYTAGSSGSGSGSGGGSSTPPGGATGDYYMFYNQSSNSNPGNWSSSANYTADMVKNTDGSYTATITDTAGHTTFVLLKTDNVINTSNQVFGSGQVSAALTAGSVTGNVNSSGEQNNNSYYMVRYSLSANSTVYFTYYPADANGGTQCIKIATTKPDYVDGSGGSGSSSEPETPTSIDDGDTVPNNSDVTFTVDSVNAGYRFVGWEENGTVVETATTYTKSGVRANYTVHARFEKGVEVTFKALNDNSQLITVLGPTFTFDGEVPAKPANDPTRTGYTFTGWSSNGGSTTYTTANIPAVSGTSAIVYVAQYEAVNYSVSATVSVSDNGSTYDTAANSGQHTLSITNTDGSAIADPSHMTHPATVKIVATAGADYQLVGIYRVHSDSTEETVECITAADGKTMTCNSYSLTTENEPAYNFVAKFKKIHYITLYNTYEEDAGNNFKFVSPPPRQVKVGTGGSAITYTYAAGTAGQRGEDHYATLNAGSTTQGTYYEGNRIPVVAGTEVKLTYSALASSDAISGVFYNNSIRYTHEYEPDNLYVNRVKQAEPGSADYESHEEDGWDSGDDNFGTSINPYTYLPATTLFADASFYSGATATTISGQTYTAAVNNTDHTVTWTAVDDYLNIDLELATKYRIIINNDEWNGIEVTNSTYNAEGYYYPGETINGSTGIEVSLDTSDASKHYSFTDVNTIQKKTGDNTYETVTDVELVKTDGKYYIRGTDADNKDMPAYDIYVGIGVREEYKMYLDNFVVADNIGERMALTELYTRGSSDANAYDDRIGTITAVTSGNTHIETDLPDSAFSYAESLKNNGGSANTHWVNNGGNWNPKYKGTNTTGTAVEAGQTVTYTFTFNTYNTTDYANYYSFVGWFEGTISNGVITPDYTKKLSGKTTFTYTPKKDTVIVAAGTRDIYLGGNFTNGGAYTTTAGQQTWSTNRIQMEFDPTYVNGNNKGRYYYKFDTVTANTEYQFRCYDTVSGSDSADLSVWQTWSGADYADDNDDIFYGRHKYDNSTNSHGQFVYKNNTNNWSLIDNGASDHDSTKNHQALGYAAPVTVYFYAYDGGISVTSEYQWSKAYVSAGRGIDCTNYDSVISSGATASYNTPTVSVANKTVGNKDVDGTTTPVTYGEESVYKCTVKEKDGQITVSACPGVTDLELDAFVVYDINTKKSEAVKHTSTTGTGNDTKYVANITVPQNSSVYIVPVYKFTDAYISAKSLKAHTVYVRTDDIDKDLWGGLVAMYSWGSKTDSGGWPGQLLIPSDDGNSFYGQLAFGAGDLRGITFNNYCRIYGGAQKTFLGTYGSDVSTRAYSGNSTHVYQTYDYREPISIIENIDDKIYEDEDMDLTFALKSGNMTAAPTIDSAGSGAYARASSFEYLTDRSGKKRVDLNGNVLATNSTETYRIVAYYTNAYASSGSYDFSDGSRNGTGYSGSYSVNWTVYDATGASTGVSGVLSAAYVDTLKSEGLTYIASKLIEAGLPVSGKAVKIAYENPGTWSETIRYSGQWYADGVNTLIEAKARVGIYSDGAWLPSDTNAPGYGTATIACPTMNAGKGENLVSEFSSGNSLAKVIKSRGTNGEVQFSVDTPTNFLGWYREDGEGGFEPVGSNYKNTTITPSFNDDITYYAFYSASASYVFEYTSRNGGTKQYTAKGTDLTDAELANGGTLNATARSADITSKLSGINNIKVFNRTLTYELNAPNTSDPYVIKYTAGGSANTYEVNVYNGSKSKIGTVTSTFGNKAVDLYKEALTGKPANSNIDLGSGDNVFIGWKKYNTGTKEAVGDYLSTQPNFGYNVTENMDIIACYGSESDKETARADLWKAYIDKNVITQELTNETTGTIYNDSIIAFRNGIGTNSTLPLDGSKECGIVILAQANSATDDQKTDFDTRGQSNLRAYANNFIKTSTTSGKMNAKYGEAYAFKIKANSLSDLNRIDLCQILDYAKFSGGKYKVMSYYYDASVAPSADNFADAYKCSEVVSADYTPGTKYPIG